MIWQKVVVAVVLAVIFVSGALHAATDNDASSTGQKKATVVDVGNKLCPVTGQPVDGKTFYKYNRKRYGFCCPMCPEIFRDDLEKYSAIAEKEVAGKK